MTCFLLFFSCNLLANVINFDEVTTSGLSVLKSSIIDEYKSELGDQKATTLDINERFLFDYHDSPLINTSISYEKVLLDTSQWTQDNEQYDLQHYLHMSKKSFLNKSESTWLSSGAGVTLFESKNTAFDDQKAFSFSLGLHSNIPLSNQAMLFFSSKIFANYFDKKPTNDCNDITCLVSGNDNVWLQKSVALNLVMSF